MLENTAYYPRLRELRCNRLLSLNGGTGEVFRSCQDAGAGGAGIAEVWFSARGIATRFSSHPFSYEKGALTAMAVNRAVSSRWLVNRGHFGTSGLLDWA